MAKSQKQKTIIRHSEGAQRLWESSLLFLKIKVGDCHEPKGSRNDDYIKKLMAKSQWPKTNKMKRLFIPILTLIFALACTPDNGGENNGGNNGGGGYTPTGKITVKGIV